MEQRSTFGHGDQPAPQASRESGQDTSSSRNMSSHPDLSQDGDSVPPTSIPAGWSEPVTCQQDLPSTASLPVMAGSKDPAGLLPAPPPPDEPYDSFMVRMGHSKTVSTSSAPQPAAAAPLPELVTLPTALPQPFPTFEGPVMTPRVPFSTPRMRMPLLLRASSLTLVMARAALELLWATSWASWVDRLSLSRWRQLHRFRWPPPTPPPRPASATGPAGPAPAQPQSGLPSGPPIPLPAAAATPTAATRPATS